MKTTWYSIKKGSLEQTLKKLAHSDDAQRQHAARSLSQLLDRLQTGPQSRKNFAQCCGGMPRGNASCT